MTKTDKKNCGLYIHQNEHGPHYFIIGLFLKLRRLGGIARYLDEELETLLGEKGAGGSRALVWLGGFSRFIERAPSAQGTEERFAFLRHADYQDALFEDGW